MPKIRVALCNCLWILGGPISYTRCLYETLKESEIIDPELYVWKTKYKLISDAQNIAKLSVDEIVDMFNTTADIVWFTFPNQEKKLSFKDEPPPITQIMSKLKIPFVVTIHRDDEITNLKNRGFTPWEWQQLGLKNLAGIIVISKQLERKVKELNLIEESKIIRTPLVYPDPVRFSDNRQMRITSLSRLAAEKRQEKVAELADFLPEKIEVYIHGRTNLFNHDFYQPWMDKGRTVWPGEFYPSDVWDILAQTQVGADFDSQEIGDKLQGVTLEFMLSGAVPLLIDNIEETRWPTLVDGENCIKLFEEDISSEYGMKYCGNKVAKYFRFPEELDRIRENNYELIEQFRPPTVLPILEEAIKGAICGNK